MNPLQQISLKKNNIKIVLLEGVHQSAVDALQGAGFSNIHFYATALPENELMEVLKDAAATDSLTK